MKTVKDLSALQPGEGGHVKMMKTAGSIRRRFRDIGLIEQTRVECIGKNPGGNMAAYLIRGAVIAIRAEDSRSILVEMQE